MVSGSAPRRRPRRKGQSKTAVKESKTRTRYESAPASFMGVRTIGPSLKFSSGTKPGSLRISGRQKLGSISFVDVSSINPLVTWPAAQIVTTQVDGTTAGLGGAFVLQGSGITWGDPVWTIGRLFNEYYVHSYCIEYVPRSSTITPVALVVAFAEDPAWLKTHGVQSSTSGGQLNYWPTEPMLGQVNGAMQFAVWNASACFDVTPYLPKSWRYIQGSDSLGEDLTTDSVAEWNSRRQYGSGTVMISGSQNTGSTAYAAGTVGDLFVRYDISYHDIGPTVYKTLADPPLLEEKTALRFRGAVVKSTTR